MKRILSSLICTILLTACSPQSPSQGDDSEATSACKPTPIDLQGPYYIADIPLREILTPPVETGQKLRISGQILSEDCKPLADAIIDVWHAGPDKRYNDKWYRGKLKTDDQGNYRFESVYPGQYGIGSGVRPAHIHFKISSPGYEELNTQLYFQDDPYLTSHDQSAGFGSDNPRLIIELEVDGEGKKGTFNVVLSP